MQQKRGMTFPFRKHYDGNSTDPANNWIWILDFHVSVSFTDSRNFVLRRFKGLLQRNKTLIMKPGKSFAWLFSEYFMKASIRYSSE